MEAFGVVVVAAVIVAVTVWIIRQGVASGRASDEAYARLLLGLEGEFFTTPPQGWEPEKSGVRFNRHGRPFEVTIAGGGGGGEGPTHILAIATPAPVGLPRLAVRRQGWVSDGSTSVTPPFGFVRLPETKGTSHSLCCRKADLPAAHLLWSSGLDDVSRWGGLGRFVYDVRDGALEARLGTAGGAAHVPTSEEVEEAIAALFMILAVLERSTGGYFG
jgi:hypothetical protein